MNDKGFLRSTVEPYIDNLYINSALLRRGRDVAALHLLRTFEDAMRAGAVRGLADGDDLRFFLSVRRAHEALPWALRWVWARCPSEEHARLDLDWDTYEEAGHLLLLSSKYYQLYRCFVCITEESSRLTSIPRSGSCDSALQSPTINCVTVFAKYMRQPETLLEECPMRFARL